MSKLSHSNTELEDTMERNEGMKKASHTPEPWEYETVYNNGEGTFAINHWHDEQSHSQEICQLTRADSKRNGQDYDAGTEEANARLIAAAPDLLQALKRWQEFALANGWTDADHQTNGIGWISETNAAISKAGGQ